MENEMKEYITFTTITSAGKEVEMAVVDEFEFEKKHYAVAALVENDTISDEGRFIFKCIIDGDDVKFEKIRNAIDYQKVAEAYMEMDEEE